MDNQASKPFEIKARTFRFACAVVANYWLRIIAATRLTGHQSVPVLLEESSELVAILTAIVRNTVANQGKK
jgi:hypothetical protein